MIGTERFIGTFAFAQNVAAQAPNELSFEQVAMMAAMAATARVTMNVGGKLVNFVYGKVKKAWTEETKNSEFDEFVETYNLSQSVALQATRVRSPEKDAEEEEPQKWVATEIEGFNGMISDLTQRNDEQGRKIVVYQRERLTKPQQIGAEQPRPIALVDQTIAETWRARQDQLEAVAPQDLTTIALPYCLLTKKQTHGHVDQTIQRQ